MMIGSLPRIYVCTANGKYVKSLEEIPNWYSPQNQLWGRYAYLAAAPDGSALYLAIGNPGYTHVVVYAPDGTWKTWSLPGGGTDSSVIVDFCVTSAGTLCFITTDAARFFSSTGVPMGALTVDAYTGHVPGTPIPASRGGFSWVQAAPNNQVYIRWLSESDARVLQVTDRGVLASQRSWNLWSEAYHQNSMAVYSYPNGDLLLNRDGNLTRYSAGGAIVAQNKGVAGFDTAVHPTTGEVFTIQSITRVENIVGSLDASAGVLPVLPTLAKNLYPRWLVTVAGYTHDLARAFRVGDSLFYLYDTWIAYVAEPPYWNTRAWYMFVNGAWSYFDTRCLVSGYADTPVDFYTGNLAYETSRGITGFTRDKFGAPFAVDILPRTCCWWGDNLAVLDFQLPVGPSAPPAPPAGVILGDNIMFSKFCDMVTVSYNNGSVYVSINRATPFPCFTLAAQPLSLSVAENPGTGEWWIAYQDATTYNVSYKVSTDCGVTWR